MVCRRRARLPRARAPREAMPRPARSSCSVAVTYAPSAAAGGWHSNGRAGNGHPSGVAIGARSRRSESGYRGTWSVPGPSSTIRCFASRAHPPSPSSTPTSELSSRDSSNVSCAVTVSKPRGWSSMPGDDRRAVDRTSPALAVTKLRRPDRRSATTRRRMAARLPAVHRARFAGGVVNRTRCRPRSPVSGLRRQRHSSSTAADRAYPAECRDQAKGKAVRRTGRRSRGRSWSRSEPVPAIWSATGRAVVGVGQGALPVAVEADRV